MNVVLAFVIFTGIALYGDPIGRHRGRRRSSRLAGRGRRPRRRRHDRQRSTARLRGVRRADAAGRPQDNAGETVTLGIKRPDGDGRAGHRSRSGRPSQIDAQHGALGIERSKAVGPGRSAPRTAVGEAIQIGAQRTVDALGLIVGGLGTLGESIVNRPTEAPPVQGPVGIATQIGDIFWQLGPIVHALRRGRSCRPTSRSSTSCRSRRSTAAGC